MATPSWWDRVPVYATYITPDGDLIAGETSAELSTRLTSAKGDVIIPAGPIPSASVELQTTDPTQPSFRVMLPAVDDPDIDQYVTGWWITLRVRLAGHATETFVLDATSGLVMASTKNGLDLRTVIQNTTTAAKTASLGLGVPGGIALVSRDGTYVTDADGNALSGGGTVIPATTNYAALITN